jgi:hypothetical protein
MRGVKQPPDKALALRRESKRRWNRAHRETLNEAGRRWCKRHPEIRREAMKRWEEKYPEKRRKIRRKWQKKHRRMIRQAVFNHYGRVCKLCGETDFSKLEIDHVYENGKEHRKKSGLGGHSFYYWLVKNNFPDGFQTLCGKCNKRKSVQHRKEVSKVGRGS